MSEEAIPSATSKELDGPYGHAWQLPVEDVPEASETICHWLITAEQAHPVWHQYLLAVVRVREVDGRPPAVYQFDGATHELLVVSLNPEYAGETERFTPEGFMQFCLSEGLPYLTPIDVCIQFEATDAEMAQLASWAVWGIVTGRLVPEVGDAPDHYRMEWKTSLTKTLAHIRGEPHAP